MDPRPGLVVLVNKLFGLYNQSGIFGVEQNLFPLLGIDPRFHCRSARSLAPVPTVIMNRLIYSQPLITSYLLTNLMHKFLFYNKFIICHYMFRAETAVAQWLRCCAINRYVAGSIPAGVNGIFH